MTGSGAAIVDAFYGGPRAALAVRAAEAELEVRALPIEGNQQGHFGPAPVEPIRLRLRRDQRAAQLGEAEAELYAVHIRARSLGWSFDRFTASVLVELDTAGERRELLVAQSIAADEPGARAELADFAAALETYVGLPSSAPAPVDAAPSAGDAAPAAAPSEEAAARHSLRLEGDALVLRDHRSRGPRERAGRYRLLALVAIALGLVGAAVFAQRWSAGSPTTSLLGFGIVPLVLFIAAFAMNEIARHANRYAATSAPLVWFADDRVVVAPWVARDGAIDTQPEGRLGAAITCGEITGVEVHERDGVFAVTLEGLHGPMEVLLASTAADGQYYARMLQDVITRVRSPKKKITALMRAAAARQQQRTS